MIPRSAKKFLTGCAGLALALFVVTLHAQNARRPNILVIWGDDIGGFNPTGGTHRRAHASARLHCFAWE